MLKRHSDIGFKIGDFFNVSHRGLIKTTNCWLYLYSNDPTRPGVDVMITIFCDFRQFSAKKLAFFSQTNIKIKNFHNLALF
jgi:hypothetical protein